MMDRPAHRLTLAFALLLGLVLAGCSSMRTDFVKKPSQALPAAFDTTSSRYVRAELDGHKDLSGFRLLSKSTNALMSRIALADHAAHSIDLQYYIFNNDATGRLVAQHVLAAADRGARVRMLLDDISLSDEDRLLAALDAHPNIQIRLFNPFRTRSPSLPSKIAQFVLEGSRLNRRMHNKSFIVDNTVAVIGGRNIGDPYFDAGDDTNFRDLDVIAIGPVVADASRTFDDYWNSDAAYPVKAFKEMHASEAELEQLRAVLKQHAREFEQSDYAQAAFDELPNGASADRFGSWFWGPATLVADQPEKVEGGPDVPALRIGPKLKAVLDTANSQVSLISPYFVPGKSGTQYLIELAKRGVNVSVLTNSLASTDEPAAHSGYARYRRDLLAGGVHLFELRPQPGGAQPATAQGTSSGVSLHAKAAVIDGRYAFVGSMNMDQRSRLLNTEMGVIVDCPPLAAAVAQFFASATLPASAYQVELQSKDGGHVASGRMVWVSEKGGQQEVETSEPQATKLRKLEVDLMRLLPIEGLL
jgi:putative cardiolipin synthase